MQKPKLNPIRYLKLIFFVGLTGALGIFCLASLLLPKRRGLYLGTWAVHYWARVVLAVVGIQKNEQSLESRAGKIPTVTIANHTSYFDIPLIASRRPCLFLAKKEVGQWPVLGAIARAAGTIFVDRDSLSSRAQTLLVLQEKIQQGFDVVIFPEGSTSIAGPQKGRTKFHSGAFRLGRMEECRVELLYIDYEKTDEVAWLGDDEFFPHLWTFLGGAGNSARLRTHELKPILTRKDQRRSWAYSREWLLEGGRQLIYFSA